MLEGLSVVWHVWVGFAVAAMLNPFVPMARSGFVIQSCNCNLVPCNVEKTLDFIFCVRCTILQEFVCGSGNLVLKAFKKSERDVKVRDAKSAIVFDSPVMGAATNGEDRVHLCRIANPLSSLPAMAEEAFAAILSIQATAGVLSQNVATERCFTGSLASSTQ